MAQGGSASESCERPRPTWGQGKRTPLASYPPAADAMLPDWTTGADERSSPGKRLRNARPPAFLAGVLCWGGWLARFLCFLCLS